VAGKVRRRQDVRTADDDRIDLRRAVKAEIALHHLI
jgi:hypothetical protein